MSDPVASTQTTKRPRVRRILLLLALITSPLFCCGSISLLQTLPASLLPPASDFVVKVFEAEAKVENRSGETLYLTPITTTYGRPMAITQSNSLRQRDIPVQPNGSVALTYDSADMPLSGIAVCRKSHDCRLLAVDNSGVYALDSFENLPALDASWLQAVQAQPAYNFMVVLIPLAGIVPVGLFFGWLYLGRLENKQKRV